MSDEISLWQRQDIGSKVVDVLRKMESRSHGNPFGHTYVTVYQLAIALAREYPDTYREMGIPLGGSGAGKHYSLASYLARHLGAKIRSGEVQDVEGAFLSNQDVRDFCFEQPGSDELLHSSLNYGDLVLSMFRLKN